MASSAHQDPKPAGLNPNMIYRPLTPPTVSLRDEEPPIKFGFHFIGVLRVVVLLLDFATAIVWLAYNVRSGPEIANQVFLWLLLFWQAFMLCARSGVKVTCQLGSLRCSLGHSDDDDNNNDNDEEELGKLWKMAWAVDAVFALVLLILTPMTPTVERFWPGRHPKVPCVVLNSVLMLVFIPTLQVHNHELLG
jgi:hypothetical protein